MLKKMFGFCLFAYCSSTLFAMHSLTTDDIGTVDIGRYEMEFGYDSCKGEHAWRQHSCGISLKHGITEKIDIGISFPYQVEPRPVESLGRAAIGFKFLLLKDIFAFGVSNELGSSGYFVNGIFTREINPVTVHANIGYEASGDANTEGKMIYSSAVEYPLGKIDLVGEVTGDKIGLQNYLFGVKYKLGEVISVNCAYGNGFRKTDEKIAFGFLTEF